MARALLHLNYSRTAMACAAPTTTTTTIKETGRDVAPQIPAKARNASVLVLGGTGRVGGSTALALSKLCPDLQIIVGSRNREKGAAMVATLGKNSEFAEVNIDNQDSLVTVLKAFLLSGGLSLRNPPNMLFGSRSLTEFADDNLVPIQASFNIQCTLYECASADVDLVVHAAGPFQQAPKCTVLEAAIETKTAYIDVCDDASYAFRAKSFKDKAIAAKVPAITTCGIYPGVSNVMAAELVRAAKSEGKGEPERLRFSYYTAGTGGAGQTILATSFLLLGEEVVAYNKGEKVSLEPYSGMLNVDFGKGIRRKDVFLLNLPEVRSAHQILGVPTVSARFGTAPFFWNWGMLAMARLLPAEYLRDRSKVQQLVQLFDPVVRAFDGIAGERVSMRVDLECTGGLHTVGIFTHRRLSVSVGSATAAFVLAVLEGATRPGVWFPEEPEGIAVEARKVLLSRASQGTINFVMNKPPWMVETEPKEVGLGIYL